MRRGGEGKRRMGLGQEGTERSCACYCPSVAYLGVGVVFGMGQ